MLLFKWFKRKNKETPEPKESPLCPKCNVPMESFTPWGCPVELKKGQFIYYFGPVDDIIWRCANC